MVDQKNLDILRKLVPVNFKAAAFDIDWTLTYEYENCPAVLESMIELVGLNRIQVILITARRTKTAKIFYEEILKSPLVTRDCLKKLHIYVCNGAIGFNAFVGSQEPYYHLEFQQDVIDKLWRYFEFKGWKNSPELSVELVEDRNKFIVRDKLRVDPKTLPGVREWIAWDFAIMGLELEVKYSGNAVDIMPFGINKGYALADVKRRLHLADEEILKVGDKGQKGGNDYELLVGPNSFTVDQGDDDNPNQVNVAQLLDIKCPDVTKYLIDILIEKLGK